MTSSCFDRQPQIYLPSHMYLFHKSRIESSWLWGPNVQKPLYQFPHLQTFVLNSADFLTCHFETEGGETNLSPSDVVEERARSTSWPLQWRHNERNGVSNHQPHDCLLNRLSRRRSRKTSKLRVTGLCEWNSPVTGEFPAQRASNAENVSIWWRHHDDVHHVIYHSRNDFDLRGVQYLS